MQGVIRVSPSSIRQWSNSNEQQSVILQHALTGSATGVTQSVDIENTQVHSGIPIYKK